MRIHLADCNTPMPDENESEEELAGLSSTLRRKYISNNIRELNGLWTRLLNLTVTLSDILMQQHRADRILPSKDEVERTETQIRAYDVRHSGASVSGDNYIVSIYAHHYELYVE